MLKFYNDNFDCLGIERKQIYDYAAVAFCVFHDIIYQVQTQDIGKSALITSKDGFEGNEVESLKLYDKFINESEIIQDTEDSQQLNTFVKECIRDTIKHSPHLEGTDDWAILNRFLLDWDLSILSSDYDIEESKGDEIILNKSYCQYTKDIRIEYGHYSKEAYLEGRHKVMTNFLAKPAIFFTSAIKEKFEEKARDNISKELVQLEAKNI